MRSALARLQATPMFQTAAMRSNAFWIVWLGLQRVPEEHQEIDQSLGDFGADLLVAADRPGQELVHVEAEFGVTAASTGRKRRAPWVWRTA
jgi:hypothetical protein